MMLFAKAEVNKDEFRILSPEVKGLDKRINVKKADVNIDLKISGEVKALENLPVKTLKIQKYKVLKVNKAQVNIMLRVRPDLKRVLDMPQGRINKLKWNRKSLQVRSNEAVLAYYEPIIEGAVNKLALDKVSGKLFVWYNPRSRQSKPRAVYLVRRLGLGEKPEWRWL